MLKDGLEIGLSPVETEGGGNLENGIPYASPVLVKENEERCSLVYFEVPCLSTSEGRVSEASEFVIVDRLTKSLLFESMRMSDLVDYLVDIYIWNIVRLHGIPVSIRMAPFKALYSLPCRSPVCWAKVGDTHMLGLELVQKTMEKVALIHKRLVLPQSHQKSYADCRRKPLSFEILECIWEVAYHLALPPQLSEVHDVFHICMLQKYEPDSSRVLDWTELKVDEDASYEERPVRVIDTRDQVLKGKTIPLVKVLWQHHEVDEVTWEREAEVREKYPDLFWGMVVVLLLACVSLVKVHKPALLGAEPSGAVDMPPPRL
ncbi:hypothetical protein CsSME_00001278 [Camellia sinensis var. sinensis]